MRNKIALLAILLVSTVAFSQKNLENYFKISAQGGFSISSESVDLHPIISPSGFEDNLGNPIYVPTGNTFIKFGSGWNGGIGLGYVIRNQIEFGVDLSLYGSSARPKEFSDNAKFTRLAVTPMIKYMIPITFNKAHFINLGAGYGVFFGGKMTESSSLLIFDGTNTNIGSLNFSNAEYKYKTASGVTFLVEYEVHNSKILGFAIGAKYYNVEYKSKSVSGSIRRTTPTGFSETPITQAYLIPKGLDKVDGSGVTFYFRINFKIDS